MCVCVIGVRKFSLSARTLLSQRTIVFSVTADEPYANNNVSYCVYALYVRIRISAWNFAHNIRLCALNHARVFPP